jgi:hypothetical protein
MKKLALLLPKSLLYTFMFGFAGLFVHNFFLYLAGIAAIFILLGMIGLLAYAAEFTIK